MVGKTHESSGRRGSGWEGVGVVGKVWECLERYGSGWKGMGLGAMLVRFAISLFDVIFTTHAILATSSHVLGIFCQAWG